MGRTPKPGSHFIALARDITERKRSEEEYKKLEFQNRQLQKAESLSRMAGAIAHNFNNKLQVVMMSLEMALEHQDSPENWKEDLNTAIAEAQKAAEVSTQMLTYLGHHQGSIAPMNLSEACMRSLGLLQISIPENISLELDLPVQGPIVQVNHGDIQQILTILLTNAWEAIGEKDGAIRISARTATAANIPATKRFPVDWKPWAEAYACLEVADDGCGIPDQEFDMLFDPFYSTKLTGRGMGLPMLLGIVKSHNGAITVESKRALGSTFRIFLPEVSEVAKEKAKPAPTTVRRYRLPTILLVDDDPLILKSATSALSHLGFKVHAVSDGSEAIKLYRQHFQKIRLVLCDLTMPHMNGWELLTALRKISPDLPVILTSGYSEEQAMEGDHPDLPQAFLRKPYLFRQLRDTIDAVLQESLNKNQ